MFEEKKKRVSSKRITRQTDMAAAKGKITFYVDIVSPFAYIAFYILRVRLL